MFYVAFGFMFIRYVCANGNLFYLGVKKPLILTVFGLDGYFLYKGVNYYILGEWFLGALVLIYLLYPLLLFCMEKSEILSSIIVFALYGFMLWGYSLPEPLFEIRESRNLISCILCFWLGMLLYRHAERLLYHRLLPIVGLLIFLGAYFIPHVNILNHVAALGMFLFLFGIGSILDRSSHLTKGFAWMASLSYPIFLVHHVLINDMASIIVKINTWSRYCIVLIFLFVITFLEGWALLQIGNAINQLPLMKSLEHRMKGSAH